MIVTSQQMQEKAIELFQEYGYENVSIQMICDAFHVTRGSFYHYFKNKEDLLVKWMRNCTLDMEAKIELTDCKDAYEQIKAYLFHWAKVIEGIGPELLHYLIEALYRQIEPSEQQTMVSSFALLNASNLSELIEKAQEEGTISKRQDAKQLERIYSYSIAGLCIGWAISKEVIVFKEEVEMIFLNVFGDGHPQD